MAFTPRVHPKDDALSSAVRPVVELLEHRQLLSVTLDAGTLTIDGTPGDDLVEIRPRRSDGHIKVNYQGQLHTFDKHDVRSIVFNGGGGDDTLRVRELGRVLNTPIFATGGAGDDLLSAGAGDDNLAGGAGEDIIVAGKGKNTISGGADDDNLVGREGKDFILGGAGDDWITTGGGRDTVKSGAGDDKVKDIKHHFPPIATYTIDPSGYTPRMQRHAYGFGSLDDSNYKNRGQGTAIAIVGAFEVPAAKADLNRFAREFDLPKPGKNQIEIVNMAPKKRRLFDEGWNGEAMLDLQWAYAIAPRAKIYMVQAATNSSPDMFAAVDRAKRILNNEHDGGVISMSWGNYFDEETDRVFESTFRGRDTRFISFSVSSGDQGGVSAYPSFSPNVVSVGGTALFLDQYGNRVAGFQNMGTDVLTDVDVWGFDIPATTDCDENTNFEITDGEFDREVIAGGEKPWFNGSGGDSGIFDLPRYQENRGVTFPVATFQNPEMRGVPDVSWNGDPRTGVPVFNSMGSDGGAGWGQVGGTSAGAPQFAGMIALVNQLRGEKNKTPVGSTLLDRIYRLGGRGPDAYFNDIQVQGNAPIIPQDDRCDDDQVDGWVNKAFPGWDYATGWGSPNAQSIIPALADRRPTAINGRLRVNGLFTADTPATSSFEWVTFNGNTRVGGYNTLTVPSMTSQQTIRTTSQAPGGGPQIINTSNFAIDMFGHDEVDGRADRNGWVPVLGTNNQFLGLDIPQGSGTPVRFFRHGNSVHGQGFITVTQITQPAGGGGGGGGGGQPTLTVRSVPVRFVGKAKGKSISGEFFAINANGERLTRLPDPNSPNAILLVRGRFELD